jgi:hypothetical protein
MDVESEPRKQPPKKPQRDKEELPDSIEVITAASLKEGVEKPTPLDVANRVISRPDLKEGIDKQAILEVADRAQAIRHRDWALAFVFINYTLLLVATMVIIFFQGFNFHGFKLESGFLNWLGGATIAEVATLAGVVIRSLFKAEHTTKRDSSSKDRGVGTTRSSNKVSTNKGRTRKQTT